MVTRAERRRQDERIKKRVRCYWVCRDIGNRPTDDPGRIGAMARTPKPCSGPCCGNPRKWWGLPTAQERRQSRGLDEELGEL